LFLPSLYAIPEALSLSDSDLIPPPEGLRSEEAAQRLHRFGFNELPSARPKSFIRIAWEGVQEPMFLLLLACGSLYWVLGDYREGAILMGWVLVILFITFFQHRKTEKSLEALRRLSAPRAMVVRDGMEMRIPGREVVPGDLLILLEGDRVPADARLLESRNLMVDEALLTGESASVRKDETSTDLSRLYSGTMVVAGSGRAIATATGLQTRFGEIGASLQSIDKMPTRLQRDMKRFIRMLFIAGAFISLGVTVAFYLTRGNFIASLLNGLAASMALLPEEFPVVLTIFMALGAWRLTRNKVLTRTPAAIETLGAATVLCSDKTGTITCNRMEVAVLYCGGKMLGAEEIHAGSPMAVGLSRVLHLASGIPTMDPMEKALADLCQRLSGALPNQECLREYPLSRDLFAMTRVVKLADEETKAYCKGAAEAVFSLCALDETDARKYLAEVQSMAAKGYRVLAAALADCSADALPAGQQGFAFRLAGLVAFEDPIRPEVPDAIAACRQAGIKVIMITGDYPETAKTIAAKAGLEHADEVITGKELQAMALAELQHKIQTARVFARIVPEQKLQIIQALKANGETVAMTGDGVNDAPALKAADIGVAMGLKGTDVAREAASLVLLDDNFATIVAAVRSGRRIFDNLQKAMTYILAIHLPIIGLVMLPAFIPDWPIMLMPLHIVFMELIIDPVSSIAFESQPEEADIMRRPPRKQYSGFFGWRNMAYSMLEGMLILGMAVGVYSLALGAGRSDGQVRALTFCALILGNLTLVLASLSRNARIDQAFRSGNRTFMVIALAALLALGTALLIPGARGIFGFELPAASDFIWLLSGVLALFASLLLLKKLRFGMQD